MILIKENPGTDTAWVTHISEAGYKFDVWGKGSNPTPARPIEENHLRYQGPFVKDFLSDGDTSGF